MTLSHRNYLEHAQVSNFLGWIFSRIIVYLSVGSMIITTFVMFFVSNTLIALSMMPVNLFFFYMILKHMKAFMFNEQEIEAFGLKGIEYF